MTRSSGGGSSPSWWRGKYKPEDFIIPGQDNNGVSMRIHCRIVPLLDRAIDILWASRRFPFKSKGDLMRWCIKRGVEHLDELEPVTGSVLMQVEAMMAFLKDEELNHAFMTLFQSVVTTVSMHVSAQAIGEARRVVAEIKAKIMGMEDGYWRTRYLKELEDKFGYLLAGSSNGAGAGSFDDSQPHIDED